MSVEDEADRQLKIQLAIEQLRYEHMISTDRKRAKLDVIRLAKETLVDNARHSISDTNGISTEDIIGFARRLLAFIDE